MYKWEFSNRKGAEEVFSVTNTEPEVKTSLLLNAYSLSQNILTLPYIKAS